MLATGTAISGSISCELITRWSQYNWLRKQAFSGGSLGRCSNPWDALLAQRFITGDCDWVWGPRGSDCQLC